MKPLSKLSVRRLFWKAQIDVLRACPPLCGVVSKVGLGAANSRKVWIKTLLKLSVQTPRAVIQHWRNQRKGRVVLSRVTPLVTTRCTLNCDKCASRIPYLKQHKDVPAAELIRDIKALLARVDHIFCLVLIGGEPLLHPDLDQILLACIDPKKVGDVSFTTNGTIIPDAKTLAAIKQADAVVKISKYPGRQPNAEQLKQTLKEHGIRYTHESSTFWSDLGTFGEFQSGSAEQRFAHCIQTLYWPLAYGKLHLCGQTVLLQLDGILSGCEEDDIDVHATTPAQFADQLRVLLKKPSVAACSYCLGCTYQSAKVPIAVQLERQSRGGVSA